MGIPNIIQVLLIVVSLIVYVAGAWLCWHAVRRARSSGDAGRSDLWAVGLALVAAAAAIGWAWGTLWMLLPGALLIAAGIAWGETFSTRRAASPTRTYDEAEEAAREAVEKHPRSERAWGTLIDRLVVQGRPMEAIAAAEEWQRRDPASQEAGRRLSVLKTNLSRHASTKPIAPEADTRTQS